MKVPAAAFALALAALPALGCGGAGKGPAPRGVAAAALPYRILRARGGSEIPEDTFYAELRQARAVCIGESHSNPHHHWSQLHIIDRTGASGAERGVGMEMFQIPFQGVLDDFRAGRIGDDELLTRSGWKDRWGFDYKLYKPIVDLAVKREMALIALNAPRELTKRVAKVGVDGLSETERAKLPELNLDDEQHRAWFEAIMSGHPHSAHGEGHGEGDGAPHHDGDAAEMKAQADRIYSAQVLWDESMAESAAKWLAASKSRRIFILAGNGHCHDSAIVGRLKRRGVDKAVSIRPIIDDGKGGVAEVLAQPNVDYVFVMRP